MNLGFIGFGEAAGAFSSSIDRTIIHDCSGFDVKTRSGDPKVRNQKKWEYQQCQVEECQTLEQAIADSDLIISAVTADQALCAARDVSTFVKPGAWYFDFNSCSPSTKKQAQSVIQDCGAWYVDVAVMAPVYPLKNKTPLLISGANSETGAHYLRQLGLSPTVMSESVGVSSSIKMIRSIMVKGLEALMIECVLAGRKCGVDEPVLASLQGTFPGFDWPEKAAYMLERMTLHGVRRSAEMKEVSLFLREIGFNETMSERTAVIQERIGKLGLSVDIQDYRHGADEIIKLTGGKQP